MISAGTGGPFNRAGWNFHQLAALTASSRNAGCKPGFGTASAFTTLPDASTDILTPTNSAGTLSVASTSTTSGSAPRQALGDLSARHDVRSAPDVRAERPHDKGLSSTVGRARTATTGDAIRSAREPRRDHEPEAK